MELKDWLNSINQTKKHLIDEDSSIEKEYPPYIVNRCLSGHLDCIMFVNEMNKYHFLPKKLQYEFLLNIVRSDSPMYFLQPPTPKTPPTDSKNCFLPIFQKL